LRKEQSICIDEKRKLINFLKNNPLQMYPYNFVKKYKSENVTVCLDADCDMKYVVHENKRMYFKQSMDEAFIKMYYNALLMEQDIDSPHRYEYGDFHVNEGDIIADIGAADGNFALSVVEKAKKIYLFECDEEWIYALKMSFAPWKDKVIIVNKYVSDTNENNCIRLDDYIKNAEINFLKVDIEGAELQFLMGAKSFLATQDDLNIAICTYHKESDAIDIEHILTENNFYTSFSNGYITFVWEDTPCLRRGLIRAKKLKKDS
jgi:hypothetical protein